MMKRVLSISLGSSRRDGKATVCLAGQLCQLERIGVDGDVEKMLHLFRCRRDEVDAFGLGGTDLYIYAGRRRYTFRQSKQFLEAAGTTPVFDGSGLKNTLEKSILCRLQQEKIVDLSRAKVLLVCGVDRAGMAEIFCAYGSAVVFGDLLLGLGLPIPIRSLRVLQALARCLAPVITRLPIRYFYPIGSEQEKRTPKFINYFQQAEIIAGDFHFIRRYMPDELPGKTIITNTVTAADRDFLRQSGIRLLVTTTPDFGGRSFGTNLLEAALYAVTGQRYGQGTLQSMAALEDLALKPSIFYFSQT